MSQLVQMKITDDLEALLNVLPPFIKLELEALNDAERLIELL